MFAPINLCRDDSLITFLLEQWLVCRLLNEVSEGNKSSSDELFMTTDTVTRTRISPKLLKSFLLTLQTFLNKTYMTYSLFLYILFHCKPNILI